MPLALTLDWRPEPAAGRSAASAGAPRDSAGTDLEGFLAFDDLVV